MSTAPERPPRAPGRATPGVRHAEATPEADRHGPRCVGIGLKWQHVAEVLAPEGVDLDFFEVHAENLMGQGGPALAWLDRVRERYGLSVHGVGLSIGGEGPLDDAHLHRLWTIERRYRPRWFSEHLAWSSHGGAYFNDLLPLAYDQGTLQRVCDHLDQLQEDLERRVLLENPSTYVELEASTLDEAEFIATVVGRTGCGLLLDVSNAYVSAVNHGRDARAYLDALPLGAVEEVHLAGFTEDRDAAGDRLLIDTHDAPVAEDVWRLYEHAVRRLGPIATLIERDRDLPALDVLRTEAHRAAAVMGGACATHPPDEGAARTVGGTRG